MLESRCAVGNRARSDRKALRGPAPDRSSTRAERLSTVYVAARMPARDTECGRLLVHLYLNLGHRLDLRQHSLILPHNAFV